MFLFLWNLSGIKLKSLARGVPFILLFFARFVLRTLIAWIRRQKNKVRMNADNPTSLFIRLVQFGGAIKRRLVFKVPE